MRSSRPTRCIPARLAPFILPIALFPGHLRAQSPTDGSPLSRSATATGHAIARLAVPIHDVVSPAPNGHLLAALQTRPRPILWIVPDDRQPFAFREWWAAYLPRWAPSGNRIGFLSAGGDPRVWTVEVDTATGRPVAPPRLLIRTVTSAFTFDPEGRQVALVPARTTAQGIGEIRLVEWASRRERALVREPGLIYWLDWSPDGKWIYYGRAPADERGRAGHEVRRVRVADGTTATVLKGVGAFLGLSPDGRLLLCRPLEADTEDGATQGDASDGTMAGGASSPGSGVEVARLDGQVVARLRLPAGGTPRWAATSDALLQVRSSDDGDEIWTIPLPERPQEPEGR